MLRVVAFLWLVLLFGLPVVAGAGDDIGQFSSELLAHESKQALQLDMPFRYSDPEHGERLRKLLAPARTQVVLKAYYDSVTAGGEPPEIVKQLEPMLKRYDKAFTANPKDFEEEYLDVLEITAVVMQRSSKAGELGKTSQSTLPTGDALLLQQLLASAQNLMTAVSKVVGRGIRDKVIKGMFSAVGGGRALDIAFRIDGGLASAAREVVSYEAMTLDQKLKLGERTYAMSCAACHQSNGKSAGPIPSLHHAPKFVTNESAISVILKGSGNGQMPAFKVLSDQEIAEVINYSRTTFSNGTPTSIRPQDVKNLRN